MEKMACLQRDQPAGCGRRKGEALRETARPWLFVLRVLMGQLLPTFLEYWGFPDLCPRTGVTSYSQGDGKLHMTGSELGPRRRERLGGRGLALGHAAPSGQWEPQ